MPSFLLASGAKNTELDEEQYNQTMGRDGFDSSVNHEWNAIRQRGIKSF